MLVRLCILIQIGEIHSVETIAINPGIREVERWRKRYGKRRWRKKKGMATIRLPDGTVHRAELHWTPALLVTKRQQNVQTRAILLAKWCQLARSGIQAGNAQAGICAYLRYDKATSTGQCRYYYSAVRQ
jgi:hypothetical protein